MKRIMVNATAVTIALATVLVSNPGSQTAKAQVDLYEGCKANSVVTIVGRECGLTEGPAQEPMPDNWPKGWSTDEECRAGGRAGVEAMRGVAASQEELPNICQRIYDQYGPSGTIIENFYVCLEEEAPGGPCKGLWSYLVDQGY